MGNTRHEGRKSAVLALSLALGGGWTVHAQDTSGPGLSSGSGQGTGAGGFSGVIRNRSGSMSGVGPGSSGGVSSGSRSAPLTGPRRGTIPLGPGVNVSFPNDPLLLPFLRPDQAANPLDSKAPTRVTSDLLAHARLITDPGERSLALQRIANGAIASNQLILAHHTLEEATTAVSQVTVPLVRDQRLIALVTSLTELTVALLRTGREDQTALAPAQDAEAAGLDPLPKRPESTVLIRLARLEWRRAVYLASIIGNPTYRNEMLYKVAEDEAKGSASIADHYLNKTAETESLGNRPAQVPGAAPTPAPRPAPAPAPAPPPGERKDKERETYAALADEILVDSWNVANTIDRLIWKNRAMVRIALSASDSGQFARGVKLALGIENAESRAEALLLLAEGQCRREQSAAATPTYQAAAEAVAAIPQDGLRGVMTGFLIDSLIAVGRFDDARACIVIYPEESNRFVALGAIAESQGRRGAADLARRWIATDVPEAYRSDLHRRVMAGVLWAVERNRSRESPGVEVPPAAR
jgi:hypothetical protein